MRQVTVQMDEDVATWASGKAAERQQSLSRYVGDLLREQMDHGAPYDRAKRRYFELRPRTLRQEGDAFPAREALHER